MKQYTTREAKAKFGEVVRNAREKPVLLLRRGRIAAVVISPDDFEGMLRLHQIVNSGCIAAGVRRAAELCANGESSRGLGLLRALAPYWRRAGIRSAPRDRTRPDPPRTRLPPL